MEFIGDLFLIVIGYIVAPFVIIQKMSKEAKSPFRKIYVTIFAVFLAIPYVSIPWTSVATIKNYFVKKQAEKFIQFPHRYLVHNTEKNKSEYIEEDKLGDALRTGKYQIYKDTELFLSSLFGPYIRSEKGQEALDSLNDKTYIATSFSRYLDHKERNEWRGGMGDIVGVLIFSIFSFMPLLILWCLNRWISWIARKEIVAEKNEQEDKAA